MYYCCVKYCWSKSSETTLFLFPKVISRLDSESQDILRKRRIAWFRAIHFKHPNASLDNVDKYRICGRHFHSGEPAHFRSTSDKDWIPSVDVQVDDTKESPKATHNRHGVMIHSRFLKKRKLFHDEALEGELNINDEPRQRDVSTQTDMTFRDVMRLKKEASQSKMLVKVLKYEEEGFTGRSVKKFTYYTGLPNIELFLLILNHIGGFLDKVKVRKLTNFQKLMLVLMKMRLNSDFTDLAYRFDIRLSTVSSIFKRVIICLHHSFERLIYWPEREELRMNMPSCFQLKFGNRVAVIIDCFEIPTERPSLIRAKVQAYSQYKSRITLKYLLGITPQGTICFLSESWGGRTSDKHVTEHCGILDKLQAGDIVLADRGFDVHVLVGERHASLNIPAFTRGRKQLSPYEVAKTRKIASVRIHVERVIGAVRNKYKIVSFNSPVPVSLLNETYEGKSLFDYIVRVSCMLTNLCDPIVGD